MLGAASLGPRLGVAPEPRKDDAIDRKAVVVDVPRAEDALTLEAGSLDHPLRRLVANHDEAVESNDGGGVEGPIGEPSECARTDASAPGIGCQPQPDRRLMPLRAEPSHGA